MRRRGFSDEVIHDIKEAFRLVFRSCLTKAEALARIGAEIAMTPELKIFVDFFENSQRGIAR
jgi:UDP-N-acetylglucosamine acyltransferase